VKTYFDSSALVAVYVTERFSARARAEARRAGQLPFTGLHELEVRNTFRVLHGRRSIDERAGLMLAGHLEEDIGAGRLLRVPVDYAGLFTRSCELSDRHSARLLCRSLDILHVACALDLACQRFVSGDDRQLRLARTAGLKDVDIRIPARAARKMGDEA
jgi:predicted nucleic acid-binding protein